MDIIAQLNAVRNALGTLSITSTMQNMDTLLWSMQALDRVILAIKNHQCDNTKEKEDKT